MQLVIPFSMPQYNWGDLQVAYKNFNVTSPTRDVERSGIKLSQSCAFKTVFKERDMGWVSSHVFLSFLIILPSTLALDFEEQLFNINFHTLIKGEIGADLVLASGTLEDWQKATKLLDRHPIVCYCEIKDQLKPYLRKFEA